MKVTRLSPHIGQAMHQAYHDYDPAEHRMMYRLLLEGDRPF